MTSPLRLNLLLVRYLSLHAVTLAGKESEGQLSLLEGLHYDAIDGSRWQWHVGVQQSHCIYHVKMLCKGKR